MAAEIPSHKVYEDAETFAILDIKPIQPGHTLVLPKDHFENIYTVPAETWARMHLIAQKLALVVKEVVNADGINIQVNNEVAAGQEIMHSHIHIIPRHNDDGLAHWPGKVTDQAELEKIRERMKEELART